MTYLAPHNNPKHAPFPRGSMGPHFARLPVYRRPGAYGRIAARLAAWVGLVAVIVVVGHVALSAPDRLAATMMQAEAMAAEIEGARQ